MFPDTTARAIDRLREFVAYFGRTRSQRLITAACGQLRTFPPLPHPCNLRMMIDLDDTTWQNLNGGYRIPFDASPALKSLELDEDDEAAWSELWENLHHQGDVDTASFAAVPHLVRLHSRKTSINWQFIGLIATIEVARWTLDNPDIPIELYDDYINALNDAKTLGIDRMMFNGTTEYLASYFGLVASLHGNRQLAQAILTLDNDVIADLLS